MTIETLKNNLPDFAKDIKLNLGSVLAEDSSVPLNLSQIYGIALASAYATKNNTVIENIHEEAKTILSEAELTATKSAAVIMAMNNVYYRFTHLVADKEYATMPAKLRMNVIANHGINKQDFELYSLAVSAINGCGLCIDSHAEHLLSLGVPKTAIQASVKIASVIVAAAQAITIVNE